MSPARAKWLLLIVSIAAYANSINNGFAFDDNWAIVQNPVVTEARFSDALLKPAWPQAREGTGNYRPVTLWSFAIEWMVGGESPMPFHALSVAAHAAVSVLVLVLLSRYLALAGALVGALFFAVHPVHTEAVANVMGRAELYAALAYLAACLVYIDMRGESPRARGYRLLALVGLFVFALGAKEIAVTLPGALLILEAYRKTDAPLWRRLKREALTFAALAGVLLSYILIRWSVLGDLTGESPSPGLGTLSDYERILTALTVWPHYLRLMVFPLDLSVDYSPGVILMTRSMSLEVLLGGLFLLVALGAAWTLRASAPGAALGFAWFLVAIIPVSNLIVRSDILLAERTLYLPSVGAAFVVGAIFTGLMKSTTGPRRRGIWVIVILGGSLLTIRTVQRNPTWVDTFTVVRTLGNEHPESWLGLRWRAATIHESGDTAEAARVYELALEVAGDYYGLLVDVAEFYEQTGDDDRSEALLYRAVEVLPSYPVAYRRLAEGRLRRMDGRGAHTVAVAGLEAVGADAELFASLSESYVAKGDLEAALRARRAALGQNPTSVHGWERVAELLDALARPDEATEARATAARLRG